MVQYNNLSPEFFQRDVLDVAPDLLGKTIVRRFSDDHIQRFIITEVEAYRGEEDLACHASKGKTPRTEVMYWQGGFVYVYLVYGMHYLLNLVTGEQNNPQAVLIRGVNDIFGPGRTTKALKMDKWYNKQFLFDLKDVWIENTPRDFKFKTGPRVGVDYAGDFWKNKPWRFIKVE